METNLEMKFLDIEKKIKTYRVPSPKEGLTAAEVNAVMDLMVNKRITGHELISKDSARVVSRASTRINIS